MNKLSNTSLVLSTLRALLGEVTWNLRGVFITKNENESYAFLNFYYDLPYSEDEEEMASITHTEVSCDFTDPISIYFKVITHPSSLKLPFEGLCLYLRYGELGKLDNFKPYFQEFGPPEIRSSFVLSSLAIIKAMWGKITPNIRKIVVTEDGLTIYIFYEVEPTHEEARLSDMIYYDYILNYQTANKVERIIKVIPGNEFLPKISYAAYVRYPELGKI